MLKPAVISQPTRQAALQQHMRSAADRFLHAQAASEHGHGEMLKLLATDGPMSSVTKPINDAVEWVTGTGKNKEDAGADGNADGHADGGDADAEKGAGFTVPCQASSRFGVKVGL